jgi:hypothetical protein
MGNQEVGEYHLKGAWIRESETSITNYKGVVASADNYVQEIRSK